MIKYAIGDGNDFITGFNETDTLQIVSGQITNSTVSGTDFILTVGNGSITIKDIEGGTNINVVNADGSTSILTVSKILQGTASSDNLTNTKNKYSIEAYAGNDTITNSGNNVTIIGGAGADVFVYKSGNDVITDYTVGQDSIKVSDTISKVSYSGKNVIFTIGSGSLTVNNAKGKDISIIDSSNKTQTYSRTLEILYDNNFITDEFGIDEITETNYSVGKFENVTDNTQICSIDLASYADEK